MYLSLVALLTVLSLGAVLATPLHGLFTAFLSAIVLAFGAYQCVNHTNRTLITHDDADGLWRVRVGTRAPITGSLVHRGYRSAVMLVLVVQSDDMACHRIALWQDQLPPRDFSYLHHQLQFNTVPRKRGSWLAFTSKLATNSHVKPVQ